MSIAVVSRPRLSRSEASASLRLRPIARRTWEGAPLLQAEPLLQANWDFSARCRRLPEIPGTVMLRLWARRGCSVPLSRRSRVALFQVMPQLIPQGAEPCLPGRPIRYRQGRGGSESHD